VQFTPLLFHQAIADWPEDGAPAKAGNPIPYEVIDIEPEA